MNETPKVEWSARCEDCRYHKKFGAAKLNCELAATRHFMSTGLYHTVHVIRSEIMSTMKRTDTAIHELSDVPPF